MKSGKLKKVILIILILMGIGAAAKWLPINDIFTQLMDRGPQEGRERVLLPSPVEVARIQRGPIEARRSFNGALEALSEFVVAPKVSGRVEELLVNLSDRVKRGQVVARLDNDEYIQAVAQAKADLIVAQANLALAKSALETTIREFERTKKLLKRGIASDSEFDKIRADKLAKQAELKMAEAEVSKAGSSLKTAEIRLGYTKVTASWTGGKDTRLVAERYLDEGQTVAANAPLMLIVEIDPIVGVVYITEKDYSRLRPGRVVSLTTDAYSGEIFYGRVDRIAPVFKQATRQARVEMTIENPGHRLKPGMFIRATVVLERVPKTTIVPEDALVTRDNQTGLFVVNEDGRTVRWRPVKVGIEEGGLAQVEGEGLSGLVVTLGQHLIDDGSTVSIAKNDQRKTESPGEEEDTVP
ncbi:MAG: efflux RND transporter periplasmic adaptor subunit [Deltaproteobacteria bacterium]